MLPNIFISSNSFNLLSTTSCRLWISSRNEDNWLICCSNAHFSLFCISSIVFSKPELLWSLQESSRKCSIGRVKCCEARRQMPVHTQSLISACCSPATVRSNPNTSDSKLCCYYQYCFLSPCF